MDKKLVQDSLHLSQFEDCPRLEVVDLCFARYTKKLLNNICFSLKSKGPTALMGPNGAGKSLLLRLLHGLFRPTSGTINWYSNGISMDPQIRQAMVFQQPVLLRRSVIDNIEFALSTVRKDGRNDNRQGKTARDWLEVAALADHSSQSARSLSLGEQQRLAVVRALALCPQVLLLDEPTASLDAASTDHVEKLITVAVGQGVKVLLITHDFGQLKRISEDVLFMHQGRIVEHARTEDFLVSPKSPVAQAFCAGKLLLNS